MSEYDDAVADFGAAKQRLRPQPLSDGGIAMPTAPAVAADPYEQAVDGLLAGRRNAAVGNMLGAGDANPDTAGRAMTIAPQTGVPAGVVETALPDYEAKIRLQRNNAVIAKNPGMTDWLASDPMHARVSSDDFDQLDVVSKTWRSFSDGWMMALQGNERGRLGNEAMVGVDVRLRQRKIDRELAQHPQLSGIYDKLQTIGEFSGGMVDNFIRGSLPTAVQGASVGLVAGGAAGAPAGGVGVVPGAAAGSLLGAVVGAVVGFNYDPARVAAGNVYLNLSETRGENGEQISTPIKEGAAILTGIATYALNNVGFKAAGRTLEQAIAHAATKPTVGRAIGNFAVGLAKTGAQGAALNTAMTGTAIFAEEFAKVVDGGDYETVFNNPLQQQQVIDQLITAATDGAMFFPIIHAANPMRGGGVRTLVTETFHAKQAKADVAAFQELEAGATESLTRGRSLTAFQSFMRSQTDGSPVENLSITGDAIRTLYQSAGKEPGPGDGLLGDVVPDLREQMRQVSETGGDIVVPTAAYVAHLAGTPISESLRAEIRFRPDGMTMREAEAYEAARGEHLAELARAGRDAMHNLETMAEPIRQVQADIEHKLRLAGQTADAAAQYAALVAARYQARAETFGGTKGTALDLYRAEGLDVRRETPESLRRVEADESDLVINALRTDNRKRPKERELFGPSLHEAVKAAGGIVDTGGELRAMDLDKAKVRGLIRKATGDAKDDIQHSADAMALRLWEMGYFPEKMERPSTDDLFDAMRRGDERFSEGAGNERKAAFEEAVRDLDEFTSRMGIDVKKASNEEIKAAIAKALADEDTAAGRTLMQGERGKITLDNGRATITLFKDADLSTFLHETGHLWLDELSRDALDAAAPEGLKADAATVAKWLGAEDMTNLTVEQHEQFARGFETYLLEGRAPSSALASAFRKFKSWLIRIYKTAAGLNVPMSDEIRGVFDRMLASEEEIAGWRQTESLNPVFATAKDAGMTDAEFRAYTKNVERSLNHADERMMRKTMASVRRARTDEWKAEAANVRAEVEPEVKARRDLKAQYYLRTGKMLDEPDSVAQPDHVRLSKAALEDMYGTDEVSKAIPRGIIAVKDGAHPDELADLFGYRSGDEMVRDLMSLEASRKQAETATGKSMSGEKYVSRLINDEVQRIMLERHGDALNDGSIEAEAMFAVHNAAQADVMAAEARAIARQAGVTALRLDDIKAWADGEIANMSTKRGTNMSAFARTEAKWGREVQRALLKGDHMAAFEAKQKQLINHILATKAGEAAEEYAASFNALRKLGKTARRETIQQSFMDQIHRVLDRMDIATKQSPEDAEAAPPLREFVDQQAAEGQDVFMPEFLLDESWRADARDMPLGEYFEAVDGIKSLQHLGRQMREMEIDGEKIRFADITASMREMLGDKARADVGITSRVTEAEQRRVGILGWRAALRRVEGWAYQMDRGDRSGPFTRYIVRPVFAAIDIYRPEKQRRLQQLWDILEPRQKELNQGKIFVPEINYTFANKGELLHAIGHTGNESNLAKLLLGRGWGERGSDGGVDRARWDAGVARMIDSGVLKKADFDMVQQIWDLLEEIKGPAQQAHKDIYGVRFNEVTSQPFQTPWGEYRGGYMPAITDKFIVEDGQVRLDEAALREQQTGAMFPSTGRGFTKSRVENYTKPLELDLALIPSHIDSVLRFTHLQPTIRDVGRLMLKRGFREMMRGVDPTAVPEMLVPWLQRTAKQTVVTPSTGTAGRFADKAWNTLRKRSGLQILAFNVTNTLQQIVGLAPAVLRSSPGGMMRSLYTYMKQPGKTAAEIAAASPFMAERMSSKTFDLQQAIQDALADNTPLSNVKHWGARNGYIFQHMAQNIVDITTWKAAYEHAVGKGTPDADAIHAANAAVRDTQGGFNAEEISRFETGTALTRLFTHMYTYFGSQANLIGTEAALVKELGFKKGASRAAMVYIFGLMIPAVIGDAIYRTATGGWDDDDGDAGSMSALASWFLGAQVKYMAPMVPVMGPVAMAVFDPAQGDRIGSAPALSSVRQSIRAPREIVDAAKGEKAPSKAIRDSLTALGLLTGLPFGQAGKPLGYAADVATGWQEPESAGDVGRGLVTGRQAAP